MFNINVSYTKEEIYRILNVPEQQQRGAWDTGYRKFDNAIYIFCNIGVAGRTGHDYDNHWEGSNLVWYAKTNTHINQPLIKEILNGKIPIHIFTRTDNSQPFTYNGLASIEKFENTSPVKIVWKFT